MNDEALREAIRGSFDDVRMRVPASALAARGDRHRARRRMITAGATAVTAAAAAAVAVTVAAPAAAPHGPAAATAESSSRATTASPSRAPSATLAAWTVTKMDDGRLKITIHEMRDPSALQATLRADGARILITESIAAPTGCTEWKGGDYRMGDDVIRMANKTGLPSPNGLEMFLRPSDIPSGAALWMGIYDGQVPGPTAFGYLTATAACLGS